MPSVLPAVRSFASLSLVLAGLSAALPVSAAPGGPRARPAPVARQLTGADVLARVGARTILVRDFIDRYYASMSEFRPGPDSLGRVEFLNSLVQRDVLGQVATAAGYEMTVEDRAQYRSYRESVLSNLLFIHAVTGNSALSEDSLRAVAKYYGRDLRLRLLYFPERTQAEYVRRQLIGGQLTWATASAKYAVRTQKVIDGLSDWIPFQGLPIDIAFQIWPLRMGQTSNVLLSERGYYLVQIAEERNHAAPSYSALRMMLKISLRGVEQDMRRRAIQADAKQGLDVVYDSTNIAWAAGQFRAALGIKPEGLGVAMEIDPNVPEFGTVDASRPIVKWKDGSLTLADVLREYTSMSLLTRPNLNTTESLMSFIDAVILGPRMVKLAEERGLDRDSTAIAMLGRKREELLVTHMVEDSVLSRVVVTRQDRRAYFDAHPGDFTTYPSIRFANIVRASKAAADSVRRAIDSGARVDSIVAADSLRHVEGTGIAERSSDKEGPFHKILFEELRPGQTTIVGPDKSGLYGVLHLIAFNPGELLPFERVESVIDESVRNRKGDAALTAFIARHAKALAIDSHPERVMRFELKSPSTPD